MTQEALSYTFEEKFKPGSIVGNFVITEKIGTGGIGTVFKAYHRLLNYEVALKIHQHFPQYEIIGIAFLQSANYLSQLNHPNIVHLNDFGFSKGHAYIAMEYVKGSTLDKLIPDTPTKEWTRLAIEYFIQLLTAVRYAHSTIYMNLAGDRVKGIIHGDIKPQNIFIDKTTGLPKLSDFMLPDINEFLGKEIPDLSEILSPYIEPFRETPRERLRRRLDRLKKITHVFGTPRYMPPEQWKGIVSIKTDIFTLGATLYEMLTNHPPLYLFIGITPTKINPFIPKWIEDVIIKAMQPEPQHRYTSVSEIESLFISNSEKASKNTINLLIKEIYMGDKIDINMGDLSDISGQIYLGKFNEIITTLGQSGQNDYAEALKLLKEAIMVSEYISSEYKKEHIEVINQIGEEAVKEKPNKTLMKALGKGLIEILKTIPDVVKAVEAVIPYILK